MYTNCSSVYTMQTMPARRSHYNKCLRILYYDIIKRAMRVLLLRFNTIWRGDMKRSVLCFVLRTYNKFCVLCACRATFFVFANSPLSDCIKVYFVLIKFTSRYHLTFTVAFLTKVVWTRWMQNKYLGSNLL